MAGEDQIEYSTAQHSTLHTQHAAQTAEHSTAQHTHKLHVFLLLHGELCYIES